MVACRTRSLAVLCLLLAWAPSALAFRHQGRGADVAEDASVAAVVEGSRDACDLEDLEKDLAKHMQFQGSGVLPLEDVDELGQLLTYMCQSCGKAGRDLAEAKWKQLVDKPALFQFAWVVPEAEEFPWSTSPLEHSVRSIMHAVRDPWGTNLFIRSAADKADLYATEWRTQDDTVQQHGRRAMVWAEGGHPKVGGVWQLHFVPASGSFQIINRDYYEYLYPGVMWKGGHLCYTAPGILPEHVFSRTHWYLRPAGNFSEDGHEEYAYRLENWKLPGEFIDSTGFEGGFDGRDKENYVVWTVPGTTERQHGRSSAKERHGWSSDVWGIFLDKL